MHRFFVSPGSLRAGAPMTLDEHAHQLHSVLRLQAGAALLLLDGSGLEYEATLTAVAPRHAAAQVGASRHCPGEPRLQVALYLCTLKADKFDWVLQKGTELGVSRFVPVVSQRSVVRPASALASKLPRWQAIVREAAEQSRRGRLPQVAVPIEFGAAIARSVDSGLRWIAWEDAETAMPCVPDVRDAAAAGAEISLLIGPEGGFDRDEVAQAQAAGWQVIGLGARILRAETASLAAVAALMALAGELGSLGAQGA